MREGLASRRAERALLVAYRGSEVGNPIVDVDPREGARQGWELPLLFRRTVNEKEARSARPQEAAPKEEPSPKEPPSEEVAAETAWTTEPTPEEPPSEEPSPEEAAPEEPAAKEAAEWRSAEESAVEPRGERVLPHPC